MLCSNISHITNPQKPLHLGRRPYFKHIHFKILSEYGGNPYFTPHAGESAHTYPQNSEMVTITQAAGPCYRRSRSHSRHERRTKEERFTLAYVLADRTIFWLRNFLKNSASNRCSAAWGPPRISCRKYKSDEEETERKKASKTNMRVQERVSHVYVWGKSSQSTLLTFIALTFTITAFKSTGPPRVRVCTCVFNVSEVWLHSELFP